MVDRLQDIPGAILSKHELVCLTAFDQAHPNSKQKHQVPGYIQIRDFAVGVFGSKVKKALLILSEKRCIIKSKNNQWEILLD